VKQDKKHLHAFDMKAQRRILQINWYDFITSDSIREQTKLVDLPLFIADMPFWATSSVFLKKHRLIPCYSTLSTSQTVVTFAAGWKRPPGVDHGKHGYSKSSWIRTVTLTRPRRKPMIILVTCRSLRLSLVRCSSE